MPAGSTELRLLASVARWSARVLGSLLLLLLLAFLIGEGPPPLTGMTVCLYVAMLGFLVAWFADLIAAALILVGVAAFYLLNLVGSGKFPGGWVFPLLYVPGVLLLVGFLLDRRRHSRPV